MLPENKNRETTMGIVEWFLSCYIIIYSDNENVFQVVMCHHSAAKIGVGIIGKPHVYLWSSAVMEQEIVPMVEMKWTVCC